jgi:DNA polymerase-3 subunit gamma/tau
VALALYRTYRPGSLAEVIGQEHVTDPLARALAAGRTHHAYLFSGPRGCGKTSTARILARSLNCEQGPTATPCGQCRSCIELAPNGPGSIDVVELDAATHRGIDDARELREKAIYAPAASRFKVYIIDEAHQLTNEAANALLKLVEEPPPHLRFIFATTEPDRIIPTIRSRTFHYGFRLVPARTLAEHLAAVCRAEGVPAEGPALAVVARAGAGSVRDSLSVLGQLLAGAGAEGLTYADAVAALGLTDAALIDALVAALAAGSAADMFGVVDRVIAGGHDPRRFVTDVLERLRDLVILRADPQALSSGLVDVPDDAGERMLAQAESMGLAELSRAADLVSAGLGELKGATAPRLQLELLCARLALPASVDDLGGLVARLERLERAAALPSYAAGAGPQPPQPVGHQPAAVPGPAPTAVLGGTSAPERGATGRAEPAGPAGGRGAGTAPPPRRPQLRTASRDAVADDQPDAGASPGAPAPGVGPTGGAASDVGRAVAPPGGDPDARDAGPDRSPGPSRSPGPNRPQVPAAAPEAPGPPAAAGPTAAAAGEHDLARVRAGWPAVLERLAADSRVAWTAFHAAVPVSLANGTLAVAVAEAGNVRAIAQRGHDERLRQALIDGLGLDVQVDVLHDPGAAQGAAAAGAHVGATASPERAGRPGGTGGGADPATPSPGGRGGAPDAGRGAGLVRAAAQSGAGSEEDPADQPSDDDPDLSGADGMALLTRELGARPVGEIDHS